MQIADIANGLWLVEEAFDRAACVTICDSLRSISWEQASVLTSKQTRIVDRVVRKQSSYHAPEFYAPLASLPETIDPLKNWLRNYALLGRDFLRKAGIDGPQAVSLLDYQRSSPGDYFNWHADNSHGLDRTLSVLCYLSDGMEGGDTEWMVDGELITIEPLAGSLVFFDANLVHRGCPVTSGTKYTALCIYKHERS